MGTTLYTTLADMCGGAGIALVGVSAAAWVRHQRTRKTTAQRRAEQRLASEVLHNLSSLTSRVAGDVARHSHQITEVSERLTRDDCGPLLVQDAIRRLLKANQQMQAKLLDTEEQLRSQAVKLEAQEAAMRTDPLTLLGNRRALEEELQHVMTDWQRRGRPFSLVLVDFDHFKNLNDVYGHAAGDEVLRGMAKVLRNCVPQNGFLARIGGEEFAILLPDTPLGPACTTAELARVAVKRSRVAYQGKNLSITASFGVAELCVGEDAAGIFHRADQALYKAKDNGHDSLCWHDGKYFRDGLPATPKTAAPVEKPPVESPIEAALPPPGAPQGQEAPDTPAEVSSAAFDPARDCFGLSNRTMFCSSVRARVSEWKRGGAPFSILLLKIHPQGKSANAGEQEVPRQVLQAAARLIQGVVRDMDLVGYYANASFSLLMPGVDSPTSSEIARRLAEQVAHLSSQAGATPLMELSVGSAAVAPGDDTVSLLQRAEADLRASAAQHDQVADVRRG